MPSHAFTIRKLADAAGVGVEAVRDYQEAMASALEGLVSRSPRPAQAQPRPIIAVLAAKTVGNGT